MDRKICSTCRKNKSLDEYTKDSSRKDGYKYICNKCANSRWKKKWYLKNLDIIRNKAYVKLYSITLDDYNEMLGKQNNVCAICNEKNRNGRKLCVDHDHNTGKIRGLLCDSCNARLSPLEDTIFYKKALQYMKGA